LALKLTLSAHARAKVKERKLSVRILSKVIAMPQLRYYDIASRAQISIARISQLGEEVHLVVVYRRNDDTFHVVTAYPVKEISRQVQRKLKATQWIPLSAEDHP